MLRLFLVFHKLRNIIFLHAELDDLTPWDAESFKRCIRRRRQTASNMSGQIRVILALPWRNNRRIDEILTQLEIASLPLEVTFWRQPVVSCK